MRAAARVASCRAGIICVKKRRKPSEAGLGFIISASASAFREMSLKGNFLTAGRRSTPRRSSFRSALVGRAAGRAQTREVGPPCSGPSHHYGFARYSPLVAVETGGIERKEMGNYLFGEIDVPALETYKSTIEPYDTTRSLQLNPKHPVCKVLIPFVASRLEEVRIKQMRKLSEARKTEQARRLASEAQRIAEVLNKDFRNVMSKLEGIRAVASNRGSAGARFGTAMQAGAEDDAWVEGTAEPGTIETADAAKLKAQGAKRGRQAPNISIAGSPDQGGEAAVDPVGGGGKRARPGGGFRVEYRELGDVQDRSKYDKTALAILINLDHPAVKNALRSSGIEDPHFKRLSYEIAFTEYSVALGYEMSERDPDIPADDLLYEVRSTLNRVAASAADLYA
jgi:hypothetical protein